MSHKEKKKKCSDMTFERSSLCTSLWDATCMTRTKRCWKEWHQSWEASTGLLVFYVQSHCVFMSPVWATIVSIWKNGFGEAVPQQSGSGAVYVTGMLMQLLHWGWSWTNGNGTTVFTRWANGKYVTSCHVQLQNECANIFSKLLGVVHILYNIKS